MLKHRIRFMYGGRLCLLPLLFLLLTARTASSQAKEEREHFQFKIGGYYDQGDFGSLNTAKSLFTLRYLGKRFDASVTSAFEQVSTNGGVRLIDGVPTRTGERTTATRTTESGLGDTVLRGRVFLLNESTTRPAITPFARVKIPTA